jgi:two-component system response regulator
MAPAVEKRHVHGQDASSGAHPVVVVDDDPDDRVLLEKELLHFFGDMPLLLFKSGQELFDWLNAEGHRPRMILLDMQLPGESGMDILKRLRSDTASTDIPVMIVSGTLDPKGREQAEKYGVCTFISKPISVMDLADTLCAEDGFD